MQTSQYAKAVPAILAEMEKEREEDETRQPDRDGQENEEKVIYVYPLEGGGVVLTDTPIEEDQPATSVVESGKPQTDQCPTARKDPPYFLHFLLLLLLFIGLDSFDTMLTTLFTPTATITIIPQQKAITTTATFPIGTGTNDMQGRVLPSLTLSQSQTVAATGKGHQDVRYATGQLTFYNGQLQSLTVSSGTVFTGRDGVQIAITQDAVIPAADPSTNPPTFGQVTVSAQAVRAGASGNIQAFDVSGSCCAASVIVKTLAPFANGQDARDFTYVTKGDIQHANETLTPLLLQSEQGALSAQLQPGEALVTPTCTRSSFSNHKSGDEATTVTITVSETCRATAYSQQALQQRATQFLVTKASTLGKGFSLVGAIQITVRSAIMQPGSATLTATLYGVWVCQLNEQQIKNLVAGKPRLDAIQLLSSLPGIHRISIAGIADNQTIPDDFTHIHLLIIVSVS